MLSSSALSEAQASAGRQSVEEDPDPGPNVHRLSHVNGAGVPAIVSARTLKP